MWTNTIAALVTSCEKWRAEFSSRQQCARRPLGGSKALAHTQSIASSPLCPALFGALGAHGSALGRQLSGARRRADCRQLRGQTHASPTTPPVSPDVRRFLRPFKTPRLRTCLPTPYKASSCESQNKQRVDWKDVAGAGAMPSRHRDRGVSVALFLFYRMEIFQRPRRVELDNIMPIHAFAGAN